ncbi:hypothetical protein [Variovorax sp. tm]|uniref:hypothetical protein n=1 Tax=Variovorax atrisoli TaxID=3394203 RepID=UPI003A807993
MATNNSTAILDLIRANVQKLRAEKEEAESVDWSERRSWWQQQIRQLYDHVEEVLRPLVESGDLQVSRRLQTIHEESLGQYEVEALHLSIGLRGVVLKPIGSVIIGGVGRIDLQGPEGTARLILATPNGQNDRQYKANAKWHVTAPSRPLPLAEMDDKTFLELFAQLIGIRSE